MERLDYIKIGSSIKNFRKEKKLTQIQLSKMIGKTESSIRKYEKGLIEIPNSVLTQIAKALNVTFLDLIDLAPEIEKHVGEVVENSDYVKLGSSIKRTRLKQKLKQSELAKKAGISRVAIGNYERNERIPNVEILLKIAEALNVTLIDLIDLTPATEKQSEEEFEEKILQELKEIKKELQDIRSILEQQQEPTEDESMVETITTLIQEHQNSKRLTGLIPIE